MSSLIYLGVPPSSGQLVSESIRQRGLSLLREAPCNLSLTASRDVTTVGYERYLGNLGAALLSAIEKKPVTITQEIAYYAFSGTDLPPFYRGPQVYWRFSEKKSGDFLERMKERFNARETVADGKVAFFSTPTRAQARALVGEYSAMQVLPRSSLYLDLNSFRVSLKLYSLFWAIARLQQYPLCSSDTVMDERISGSIFFEKSDAVTESTGKHL